MAEKRRLVLVGAGAFGEIAHEYFSNGGQYEVAGFAADREFVTSNSFCGLPLVAVDELTNVFPPKDRDIYVAMLYNQLHRVRTRLLATARALGYSPASYISPHAWIAPSAQIGPHCFIFENNVIQSMCTVGENVVLWSGNH